MGSHGIMMDDTETEDREIQQGDKSLIVWAPPLGQCNHCQVCSWRAVLLSTDSYRPLHSISKHQLSEPRNARGVSVADPPRVTDSKVTVISQRVTAEAAPAARRLAVTWPSSPKALPLSTFNAPHPVT